MHTKFYHLVFCFVLFLIFSKIQIAVQFLSVNFFFKFRTWINEIINLLKRWYRRFMQDIGGKYICVHFKDIWNFQIKYWKNIFPFYFKIFKTYSSCHVCDPVREGINMQWQRHTIFEKNVRGDINLNLLSLIQMIKCKNMGNSMENESNCALKTQVDHLSYKRKQFILMYFDVIFHLCWKFLIMN